MDPSTLSDTQAFILHTYWPCALRTFVLQVQNPDAARRFLGSLVNGDASAPQLATADQWQQKQHKYRVNVGITHAGLKALELPESSLDSFPQEFIEGALARAAVIGDTEESAPEHWQAPFAGQGVHILLFLFITDTQNTKETIDSQAAQLRRLYSDSEACRELSVCEADSLPHNVAHFGYNDGFAQPTIAGGPPAPPIPWRGPEPGPKEIVDILPKVSPGEFLLDPKYPMLDKVPTPDELCKNGSYAAFRILEQDCHGFEAFLEKQAKETGRDKEWIAAKLCGRWRSGAPLTLFPDADDPRPGATSVERCNSFDYVKTDKFSPSEDYDDSRGTLCPIGSHIRRMNPRHADVANNSGLTHRIVRRGLPYGPAYDKDKPDDGIARGLMGLFIGASLKNQFEFLMAHWANDGGFAGIGQTKDPILGANNPADSKFVIPVAGRKPVVLRGFSRFVRTRGSAYCFLPSVTALKYLAGLPPPPA